MEEKPKKKRSTKPERGAASALMKPDAPASVPELGLSCVQSSTARPCGLRASQRAA